MSKAKITELLDQRAAAADLERELRTKLQTVCDRQKAMTRRLNGLSELERKAFDAAVAEWQAARKARDHAAQITERAGAEGNDGR